MTMEEISWFVDDTVTRALQGKPGIGRVTRIGGADREIRVELDPVKLDSYGVTAQAISARRSRPPTRTLGRARSALAPASR
jgi:multidrug efflux pump subunit AcrB